MTDVAPKAPAISYAAAILRHLANQTRPSSLSRIARAINVRPSSCLNYLRTLVSEGFVSFNEQAKTYALGSSVIALARRALDPDNTMRVARDVLRRLARRYDVTATLWRLTNDERLILVGAEMSETDMHLHMTLGQRVPLLKGAVGRSMTAMSDLSVERLQTLFVRMRWEETPTFEQYVRQIDQARRKRWAWDCGGFVRGVTGVAAAVCDQDGQPQFGVSVAMLHAHHSSAFVEDVGTATLAAAVEIRQMIFGVASV